MIIRFSDPEFIHYTLHPGTASGILDIHKTNEQLPSADPERHETVVVKWLKPSQREALRLPAYI